MTKIQLVDSKLSKDTKLLQLYPLGLNFTTEVIDYMMLLYLQGVILHILFDQSSIQKIYNKRHFIEMPFINKGMHFIDLPSILRGKSVHSSISKYFKNGEVPLISNKYDKPIRIAIFNFNKIVLD